MERQRSAIDAFLEEIQELERRDDAVAEEGPRKAAEPAGQPAPRPAVAVQTRVERFDRRGTEPFELFRSEFGQNSCTIQEFSPENSKNSGNFNIF